LPGERALALLCVVAFGGPARAAETAHAVVEVSGALPRSASLGQAELSALGAKTTAWTVQGTKRQVTGVRLDKVLTHLGFSPGPMGKDVPVAEKRAGYRKAVIATAADGYRAVFSVAECVEGMGPTEVLVVWAVDGKPLPPEVGPSSSRCSPTASRAAPSASSRSSRWSTSSPAEPRVQPPGNTDRGV
jgi:DMSO/TMAO reductase YedYZ molybdopterin-dependent catalytic subunit